MASLVDGKITNDPLAPTSKNGEFKRGDSRFRTWPLSTDIGPGRYHLYVSYACPWAHRTIITRSLKKLDKVIDLSVSEPFMGDKGWTFSGANDPKYLAVLYVATDKMYTGKITVPVLWDKKKKLIVNNESADILRILNSSFDKFTDSDIDLYPDELKTKINAINEKVYENINNGVYKTGFAGNQKAYEASFDKLFETLDEIDDLLGEHAFLTGDYFTEADLRLFTTLLRFDPVYYLHFKCNKKRIFDYTNLYPYLKSIYQVPEIKKTCHFDHIKEHYYTSHSWINPSKIVPKGPEMDLDSPHNRGEVRFWRHH